MTFVAFQQFEPQERKTHGNCIWCGEVAPTNRAHIISRKLATGARNAPTLRFSVCTRCNSICGKLERWILQFTPLAWVRMMLYLSPGSKTTSRRVPSYFFSAVVDDWVVFHLDAKTRSYVVPTQLLLMPNSNATLLTQAPLELHEQLLHCMMVALQDNTYTTDIRNSLPAEFSPRLLLENEKTLLIAHPETDLERFIDGIQRVEEKAFSARKLQLTPTGRERHHYQWSKSNWARFCAKAAFEALCLFEGGEKCLRPTFRLVREFVLGGVAHAGREVVFDERGPREARDVPLPVMVDLSAEQAAPQPITAILAGSAPGMHIIVLYEIRGWVIASVEFAGFPPSVLVLGGPNEHLDDLYMMVFDDEEATYRFLRLAYDQTETVIPIPIPGERFLDLAETYRLRGV